MFSLFKRKTDTQITKVTPSKKVSVFNNFSATSFETNQNVAVKDGNFKATCAEIKESLYVQGDFRATSVECGNTIQITGNVEATTITANKIEVNGNVTVRQGTKTTDMSIAGELHIDLHPYYSEGRDIFINGKKYKIAKEND